MDNETIQWQAPEHHYHEKTIDWYWVLGIIVVGLIIASIFLGNILFGILMAIGGFALAIYGTKKPKMVDFSIDYRGVKIDKNLFHFEDLKSFWVNHDDHENELLIESNKTLMPQISIILGDTDPIEVRRILLKYLKEEKITESIMKTISRVLKF